MRIKSKFWLEDESGKAIFGEGRRRMLELIDELGSMQATAKTLGMSYRGVWARLKATEDRLGLKLVETSVGRGKNRGSKLTPEAKQLLANYKLLLERGVVFSDDLFASIFLGVNRAENPVTPVLVVCGPEGSGKTALITGLIREWASLGRTIGVIESQGLVDLAHRDSETSFAEAEAVIKTDGRTVNIELPAGTELNLDTIAANYALGCDLVLVKSVKSFHLPNLEIYRQCLTGNRLLTRKKKYLVATVGDQPEEKTNRPHFSEEDLKSLVELIDREMIQPSDNKKNVRLKVNGKVIPMLPFVQEIFRQGLTGMVASLKSCENPKDIELVIDNNASGAGGLSKE